METIRTFIAIDLSEKVKKTIEDVVKEMKNDFGNCVKMKWVEKENYHITLKFLGNILKSDVKNVIEKMNICFSGEKRFSNNFHSLGKFPENGKYVKVIFMKIEKDEKIKKIHNKLETQLNELGFGKEQFYVPHLTLARVKYVINKREFIGKIHEIFEKYDDLDIKFNVEKVTLYESKLKHNGPEYTKLHEIKFK